MNQSKQKATTNPQLFLHSGGICLLLALASFAVFYPVVNCDFINLDDPQFVVANPHVARGFSWEDLWWALRTGYYGNWVPLTWISHMLDCQLFGLHPAGHHFVNLLFHVANTVLVFLVLQGLTGTLWRSACVAALFGVHPLHVESVAWVAERRDVLCGFFWLLSLWAYARYVYHKPINSKAALLSYSLTLFFFAGSLMSKAMAVTLPLVMLLLDYWPLKRFSMDDLRLKSGRLIGEKLPFLVVSLIAGLVTFRAQNESGFLPSVTEVPMWNRMANVFLSYGCYLSQTFWPTQLAIPYPYPQVFPVWPVVLAVVMILAISAMVLWQLRRRPFLAVGWLWYQVTLLPVIGFIQVSIHSRADRYMYIPIVGLFIVLVWSVGELFLRCRLPKPIITAVAALVLAACAIRTMDQLKYWRNSGELFRHSVAITVNNYFARNHLGLYLVDQGRVEEGVVQYRVALDINPQYEQALNNLGNVQADQGRLDEAIELYSRALKFNPDFAEGLNNLGKALADKGRVEEAVGYYQKALAIRPDNADALNNLGVALASKRKYPEAIKCYETALHLTPGHIAARFNLGNALASIGKLAEAAEQYTYVLRYNAADVEAHKNLALVMREQGQVAAAIGHYQTVLRLRPDDAAAREQLRVLGGQPAK